jgi:hypothetical protein
MANNQLQVYLQGAVRDRRDQDWNHQSHKLINIEFGPAAGFCDGIKQTRTGEEIYDITSFKKNLL